MRLLIYSESHHHHRHFIIVKTYKDINTSRKSNRWHGALTGVRK